VTVEQPVSLIPPIGAAIRAQIRFRPIRELPDCAAIRVADGKRVVRFDPKFERKFSRAEGRRKRALVGEIELSRLVRQKPKRTGESGHRAANPDQIYDKAAQCARNKFIRHFSFHIYPAQKVNPPSTIIECPATY
jgi:hypothetical protein